MYHLVMTHIAMENPLQLVVYSWEHHQQNGQFSMAVLNNQRVISSDVLGQIEKISGDLMGIEAAKMVNTRF